MGFWGLFVLASVVIMARLLTTIEEDRSMTRTYRGLVALCLAVALLAGIAAAFGVFARGDGSTEEAVSIRGERFEYVTSGVYKYNAERVVAEGAGWDAVTLFLAVPALLIALPGIARGSLRARLVALGLLGYLVYQYLMYSVYWALGPLFPLFIVLYPMAAAGIIWIVHTIDVGRLPERFSARFPRRGMIAASAAVGLLLIGMWSQRIVAGLRGDIDGILLGTPTLAIQALDLGVVVPFAFLTAGLLYARRPSGFLLATALAVKGVTMAAAICAMLIVAALVEGGLEVVPFAIFATVTLAFGWLAFRMFASVKPDATQA
ncbi:MAG: hypothetical protein Kow0067_15360 [Coriobacteriia bacterium]